MARLREDNLLYFPVDVGFTATDKLKLIRNEFGDKSLWIIFRLWDSIYGGKGYYYKLTNDTCLLLSEANGGDSVCPVNYIKELINGCLRRSIFDDRVYKMFGILTSNRIQQNYFMAKRSAIKKQIETKGVKQKVYKELFLLTDDDLKAMRMEDCFHYALFDNYSRNNQNYSENNGYFSKNNSIEEIRKEEIREELSIREIACACETENILVTEENLDELYTFSSTMEIELLLYAVREAVVYKKLNFAYIRKVLMNWISKKIFTVEDYETKDWREEME